MNELITNASKTETASLSLQQGMKLQQSLTEGVFDGTSLEQRNKGSFDTTRLNYGLKQLYLALYDATPQAPCFLPFFLFCACFALSSPIVLTVLEDGMWSFPPASASHALQRLTWACPHQP